MKNKTIKEKLANRELTIGSWLSIGHPSIPEILSNAGFDWLVIDIEHTTIDLSMVQILIASIQSQGIAALVRVSKNEDVVIKRVLDAGADGIIVPMVCNADDAQKAVVYAKYPPEGKRGVGLFRAQQYGSGFDEYKEWVRDNLIIIAQIEHIEGINNLEEIINVKGIDGTIIGPYDLSGSMGVPGQIESDLMKDTLNKFVEISRRNNFSMGFHIVEPNVVKLKEKVKEGYNFIAFGVDFLFIQTYASKLMKEYKENKNL